MNIFNDLIKKTLAILPENPIVYKPDFNNLKIGEKNELILGKEAAYELGGENLSSAAYNLYTEDASIVDNDEILLYGKDLYEIKNDISFARIAIIRTENATVHGEQALYSIIENINLKRYDVYPSGYMVRTSVLSNREQVRLSKKAIKNKLSFKDVGSIYINELKKNKYVKAVKIIFITSPDVNYTELNNISNTSLKIFRALNHAVTDLKMDCNHCEWKLLCDEIDGIKELHKQIIRNEG